MAEILHHVALFVSDMEKMLHIFQSCLGFELAWRLPRAGGARLSAVLGLPEMEAEIAYLHAQRKGTAVELVRLIRPSGGEMKPAPVSGTAILSLLVENLDSLNEKLREEGFLPFSAPLEMRSPEGESIRVCCIRMEQGLTLELFERRPERLPGRKTCGS